ncbi:MCP four helix bundle domain-containing protein [Polaribacter sp. R77954]|uniref:MCP four helix bundle domain-containing protein n=1 Tax=Polaribacter sp. R77954 TaxID=3093870 RepID=UPI0037C6EDD9
MTVFDKIKWILGVLIIFVLIITTNLIDKDNFTRVKDTALTIYEDRLIAKDLIFKVSNKINTKEVAIISNNLDFFQNENKSLNKEIDNLLFSFEQTNLTTEESYVFNDLKEQINALKTLEKPHLKKSNSAYHKSYLNIILQIKKNLINLSEIQLREGARLMAVSKKALSTIELFTQIEIYFLVFLAVIVQIIIIYNPKKKT